MKVLKAWRRTMLSILASMAFLPVAFSSTWSAAQEGPMPPQIERGADGLGYYAPGYEPDAQQGYAEGYYDDGTGPQTPGEAFVDDMDTEVRNFGAYFRGALGLLAPYGEGGRCAPRWYDASIEAYFLDRGVSRDVTYMANGLGGVGGPALGTQNLNFDYEGVMRFTFAGQVGPAGLIEFSYLGLGNWSSFSSVSSPNDLYSPFSQFGIDPPLGYDQTDEASFASLAYSSTFDSYELNLRRRWQGPTCLFQGSYMAGVRHFRLEETAIQSIVGRNGTLDYTIGTSNALTGFQIGGDVYFVAIPGVMIGGEMKGGIFGNNADQVSTLATTTGGVADLPVTERLGKDTASFVGEAGVHLLYRITQNVTLKGGYHCLYVSSVALAAENANFAPAPSGALLDPLDPRTPRINNGGSVFYHGATGGVELSW